MNTPRQRQHSHRPRVGLTEPQQASRAERLLKWQDEEVARARAWAEAKGVTGAALEAYVEGVRQGYRAAIAAMTLHNLLRG